MDIAYKIKVEQIKRMSNSIHRRELFDLLDDMEMNQLVKAYRNMPKKNFKSYLIGFLDAAEIIEKSFVVMSEDGKNE